MMTLRHTVRGRGLKFGDLKILWGETTLWSGGPEGNDVSRRRGTRAAAGIFMATGLAHLAVLEAALDSLRTQLMVHPVYI
jgi:hypothetical protein